MSIPFPVFQNCLITRVDHTSIPDNAQLGLFKQDPIKPERAHWEFFVPYLSVDQNHDKQLEKRLFGGTRSPKILHGGIRDAFAFKPLVGDAKEESKSSR